MPIIEKMEQGSPEWLQARVGCITMSNAGLMLSKGRGNQPSKTRESYLLDVASEILSGQPAETPKSWMMERGNLVEPFARAAYTAVTGIEVKEVGIGYLNAERRIAASPDGLTDDAGIEIKCPAPKQHLRNILNGLSDPKYIAQIQGCMWIFETEIWHFISFCPELSSFPLYIETVKRDEELITRLQYECAKGVAEVDGYVKQGMSSVSPEVRNICAGAIDLIDEIRNPEPEIF